MYTGKPTKQLLLAVSALCIEADLTFEIQEFIYPEKSQPNWLFLIV